MGQFRILSHQLDADSLELGVFSRKLDGPGGENELEVTPTREVS